MNDVWFSTIPLTYRDIFSFFFFIISRSFCSLESNRRKEKNRSFLYLFSKSILSVYLFVRFFRYFFFFNLHKGSRKISSNLWKRRIRSECISRGTWENVDVTHEFVLFHTHVLRPRLERLTGSFGNDLEQRLLAFARLSPSTASTTPILHSLSMGSRAIISFPCSRWKRERVANYEQFILRLNGFFRIFERTKLMISVYLPSFHFRSE